MARKMKRSTIRKNTSVYVIGRHYDEVLSRSFARGLVSIVKTEKISMRIRSPHSDARAISSDWRKVGGSIRHSMIAYQCN